MFFINKDSELFIQLYIFWRSGFTNRWNSFDLKGPCQFLKYYMCRLFITPSLKGGLCMSAGQNHGVCLMAWSKFEIRNVRIIHSISKRFCQCFSYIIDRVQQNSPSMHFRRANMDSGGPIPSQKGQYGFRRANMDSVRPIRNRLWIFRKANTKPSIFFRRANTETY